jgi:hypothetical protein
MVRLTKEERKQMMEYFFNDVEMEIGELINMDDDENEEYHKYKKDEYNWSIKKNIFKNRNNGKSNLIELVISRDNNGNNNKKKGEAINESCWVYIENKNIDYSTHKDAAIGKANSKIMNGLSYITYRISIY